MPAQHDTQLLSSRWDNVYAAESYRNMMGSYRYLIALGWVLEALLATSRTFLVFSMVPLKLRRYQKAIPTYFSEKITCSQVSVQESSSRNSGTSTIPPAYNVEVNLGALRDLPELSRRHVS